MKTSLIPAVVCVSAVIFAGSLVAADQETTASEQVSVAASRNFELRVAVIELGRHDISSPTLNDAFATAMSTSMSGVYGSNVPVKVVPATLPQVAMELSMGSHDAVLVIGNELPSAFRKSEFTSTRVVPEIGVPARTFHLVVRNDDADFKKAVSSAFESAIVAPHFQECFTKSVAIRVTVDPISAVARK